jgi:serine/threonine protein kinase
MMSPKSKDSEKDILGKQVGQWQVKDYIGKGGIGDVWLVQHHLTRKIGAMKILKKEYHFDKEIRDRFLTGFEEQARYEDNEHIIKCFDGGHDEKQDVYYLVMEYIYGSDLDYLIHIERKKFTWDEILLIMEGVTIALCNLHKNGTIHRDLKPANILIQNTETKSLAPKNKITKAKVTLEKSRCRIVLTDFDIVKTKDRNMTSIGEQLGTPQFMSPEQRDNSKNASERSDIYSLGQILYELVTGHRAQTDRSITSQASKILKEGKYPPHVIDVIKKATEYDEGKRYRTVRAMFEALGKEKRGAPTTFTASPKSFINYVLNTVFLKGRQQQTEMAKTQLEHAAPEEAPQSGREKPPVIPPVRPPKPLVPWPLIAVCGIIIIFLVIVFLRPQHGPMLHDVYIDTIPANSTFDKNVVLFIVDNDTIANRLPIIVKLSVEDHTAGLYSKEQERLIWQGKLPLAAVEKDSFFIPIMPDSFMLSIATIPAGATVLLNNKDLSAKTPFENYKIEAGQVNLQLKLLNYKSIDTTIFITENQNMKFTLKRLAVPLRILVNDTQANGVNLIDRNSKSYQGEQTSDGLYEFTSMLPGPYQLQIRTNNSLFSEKVQLNTLNTQTSPFIQFNYAKIEINVSPKTKRITVYGSAQKEMVLSERRGDDVEQLSCELPSGNTYFVMIENIYGGQYTLPLTVQPHILNRPDTVTFDKMWEVSVNCFEGIEGDQKPKPVRDYEIYICGQHDPQWVFGKLIKLPMGTYTVEIRKENMTPCQPKKSFEITENSPLIVNVDYYMQRN